jgi:hypothetical protein
VKVVSESGIEDVGDDEVRAVYEAMIAREQGGGR